MKVQHRLESEVPPKPKAIYISAKAQLWAQYEGIDIQSAIATRDAYNRAKKDLRLASISYIQMLAESALTLATRRKSGVKHGNSG